MPLKIYNTLTKKKEFFIPLKEGEVGIYPCGPTVNNYIHMGHARNYIFWDVVKRYFEYLGYRVKLVSNITDIAIDEKLLKEVKQAGMSFQQFVEKYTRAYFEDRKKLGLALPDVNPSAMMHIQEMIELIEKLIEKGYAYETEDGVYFSIKKFKDYGKLSGISPEKLKAGASGRVKKEEYDKENVGDFVLWKKHKPGEPYWYSPWGKGRPGWHIECSAMSMKYLGETFDLHGGGEDLIFPHHENEIAQSEAATGKKFVRYWMHVKHLLINGQKMSKSLGNFLTVRDAVLKYGGLLIRFFLIGTHYRSPIDFNERDVNAARVKLERLKNCVNLVKSFSKREIPSKEEEKVLEELTEKARMEFEDAMNDDFNTSLAITSIMSLVKEINSYIDKNGEIGSETAKRIYEFFKKSLTILLGDLFEKEMVRKKDERLELLISLIAEIREEMRKKKEFEKADKIREKLRECGIILEDTEKGPRWKIV